MQTIHCDIHNLDILVYNNSEIDLFVDNNEQKVVIFIDEKDLSYKNWEDICLNKIKRFIKQKDLSVLST